MSVTGVLLFYVVACAAIMYVLMMGPTRYHRDGFVGKLNRWMHDLPSLIGYCLCIGFSCGNRQTAKDRWARVEHRIMRKKNPAVMFFYIIVVGGAVTIYAMEVITRIGDPFMQYMSSLIIALSATSFIVCVRSDPGIVTPSTEVCEKTPALKHFLNPKKRLLSEISEKIQNEKYTFDEVLYASGPKGLGNTCSTCQVARPARSKHCSLCGYCVRRYDHHCPWINNDVAENNHRYFLLFLYIHMILCFIAAFDSFGVLGDYAESAQLWTSQFVNKRGEPQPPSWRIVIMYCLFKMPWVVAIFAFGFIVGLVLVGFLIFQLKGVVRGVTSNESNKIEDVVDLVENVESFEAYFKGWTNAVALEKESRAKLVETKKKAAKGGAENFDASTDEDACWVPPPPPKMEDQVPFPTFMPQEALNKYIQLGQESSMTLKEKKKKVNAELLGTYSRGSMWRNFLQVMFPYHDLDKIDNRPAPNTAEVTKNAVRLMFGKEKKKYNRQK